MFKEKTESIILLSAIFLFIFLMGISKIADYDIFYHLATGMHILKTGKISHLVDPFSYTSIRVISTTSAWLADVIFYNIYSFSGIAGLTLFKSIVITLILFIVYLNMRILTRENPWSKYIFILLLIIAAFAVRMRMFIRPFIFEFLLLAIYFYILNLYRVKHKNYIFMLPLLQIVWTNIHSSNIMGVLVLVAFLAGEGLKYFLILCPSLNRKQLLTLFVITLLVIAVSGINPAGYKVFSFPFVVTRQGAYMTNIDELQPLTTNLLIGYGFRYTWGFSLLLILSIFVFLYQRKKVDLTELIIFCLFLFIAIRMMRLTAEFVIAVAPIAARGISEVFSQFRPSHMKRYNFIISGGLIAVLFVVFYTTILNGKIYAFGIGLKKRVFPVKAVDFLIENDVHGNMYNSIGYGGYLMWRLFPEQKVFIDGRGIEAYDEGFYMDYLNAHFNPDVWKRLVDTYSIDWVITEYSRDYVKKERIAHLADNPEWSLIYWDREAIVYAKRGSKNGDIIKRFEYRYAKPNDLNPTYLNKYLFQRGILEEVVQELKRNLYINPDNEESHLSLAYIYFNLGMRKEEFEEMKKVVEINPELSFAHSALGEIYMHTGDLKTAEYEFKEAMEINPKDNTAITGLQRLMQMKKTQ